ncbi:MAG: proton-conducting transporter membrane subunit [Planctomycetota bacterium]
MSWLQLFSLAALVIPVLLFLLLGVSQLLHCPLREKLIGPMAAIGLSAAILALLMANGLCLYQDSAQTLDLGRWFSGQGHAFRLFFLLDVSTLPLLLFANLLVGVVEAFTHRYLHREPGYHRFQLMLFLFLIGLDLVLAAGSMEMLVAGWEFLGLSSALLIAFFHERSGPIRNGLRVFSIYRFCDVALVSAFLWLHAVWPDSAPTPWQGGVVPTLPRGTAEGILLLLLFAVSGKSALLPFSSWLPRAMEGPTPSSAIFYGALSVHAGPLLLLRFSWLMEQAPAATVVLGILGALTSLCAALVARTQTEIKSLLAYATVTQVGLIMLEISLGWHWIPLLHIAGHATLRSLQFLRAPSLLHDRHNLEDAIGGHLAHARIPGLDRLSPRQVRKLYQFSLHRAWLDELLDGLVIYPWQRWTAALVDVHLRLEQQLAKFVSKEHRR